MSRGAHPATFKCSCSPDCTHGNKTMKRKISILAAAVAGLFSYGTAAHAAVISSSNPTQTIRFDLDQPDDNLVFSYSFVADSSDGLANGASFDFLFGTTSGASDLGSLRMTNNFPPADFPQLFSASIGYGVGDFIDVSSLDEAFLTVRYVDDTVNFVSLGIFICQRLDSQGFCAQGANRFASNPFATTPAPGPTDPVPVPGAAVLMLSALAGAGVMRRKASKKA